MTRLRLPPALRRAADTAGLILIVGVLSCVWALFVWMLASVVAHELHPVFFWIVAGLGALAALLIAVALFTEPAPDDEVRHRQ